MGPYVTGLLLVAFLAVQPGGIYGLEDWDYRRLFGPSFHRVSQLQNVDCYTGSGESYRGTVGVTETNEPSFHRVSQMQNVDCYTGSGENYRGTVGVTETNEPCLAWNANDIVNFRSYSTKTITGGKFNIGPHNFCRNPMPGVVTRPWCYVASKNDWAFCMVSKCAALASGSGVGGSAQRATAVMCPALTAPPNAVTGCAKNKKYPVGHKCWVLCPTGQKIMTTECQGTGKWSVGSTKMTCTSASGTGTSTGGTGSGTGGTGGTSGGIGPLTKVCPALNVPTAGFSNCKGPQRVGAICGVGCLSPVTVGVEYIKTTCMSDLKWTKPPEFTATKTKLGCAGTPVIDPKNLHKPGGSTGGASGGGGSQTSTTCYKTADKGKSYRGTQAKTKKDASGKEYPCLKWDDPDLIKYYYYNTNNFPNNKDGIGKHNQCRNPAPEAEPWCYYKDSANKVQFMSCGVPKCP